MTEQSDKLGSIDAPPTASGVASFARDKKFAPAPPESRPVAKDIRTAPRQRRLLIGVVGVVVLGAGLVVGVPWIEEMLATVSTDDAFVNGHVTFVAPRVPGQVLHVLVDDNNRVRKGDLLVELDKEPYRVAVSEKQAAVDTAQADLQAAIAAVRATEAQARSRRWDLQRAVQDVDSQVALLHARVAAVYKSRAELALAQVEFDRARQLVPRGDTPREVYDQRQAELTTAGAQLAEALAEVAQIRVSLGLPARPDGSADLGHVPSDLDETFSSVLEAQAALIQSAAQLGVVHSFDQGPKAMLDQFDKLGDIDSTFMRYAANAPAIKQAEAKLEAAKRDLAQAELNLRYCDIRAEIDGVVTRRNINPGNYVQVGQSLMAVRSLSEIWVDANFKETQLRYLRIGQPVDLRVDMYGDTHSFKGRVSGFTEGTGSTLALLPPENATGNFVKVVQRLPIRIDLVDYNADQTPLFIGTSVVPHIYIDKPPTGPGAGKFIQAYVPQSPNAGPASSAAGTRQ
ncbi:HlyD family secretion protein [Acidisphaera rubrifaciens]|uniref:Secretion protein HlyD n=1 Tax=Acidisphaera rubrifaciens HS-AP3 TaxID=1231350 RepID=A0A0D6P626_9PROT|nr:HlyD family secretion protein [Acidisphaera rubrifaciens]GAN77210.1 secretion protein HlyD [Acidisphaera rubrifaciens HS-AP3]